QQNKAKAMDVLASRIIAAEEEKKMAEDRDARKSMVGSGDRSEKIRTYNFPQDRVTDHRIGMSVNNITGVMDGNIEPILDKLKMEDNLQKLAASQE
ncbi:MAG: peptide chain release factor-like protein, partial [Patescibacteria group bacterium]|nr:peptide chain release factor-like protein [Patescibacteria group bacterium]